MNASTTGSRGASIQIKSACKHYGTHAALKQVDLHIRNGEFMTLLGPSGSGKTTTLNLIAGFTEPTSGDIELEGRSIKGLPPDKRNIGVVFQHYALFPHLTVYKNILYPLVMRGIATRERERLAQRIIELVRLEAFRDRYPSQLSGGQQQRVALARAIVFNPPLLLMDEPLGALDKKLRERLQLEIKRIHRELGSTFVYVTHDQEEALTLSDRIAVFSDGRIEQVGTGAELYNNPSSLFVGTFIGDSSIFRGSVEAGAPASVLHSGAGRIICPGCPAGNARDEHVALVRPENISIWASGQAPTDGGLNRVAGIVAESVYLGASAKYEVRLEDGSTVLARHPAPASMFHRGDAVALTWRIDDTRLLPHSTNLSQH